MNWVCESCGYENEYNDESQPTECLCCGEPASEHLLNQARRALEKYHKEQERQRRLEQLRQEAIKRQEKIEHSINAFIKGVREIATACIVVMILAVAITGFNVYKGNVTPKYIGTNIKNIYSGSGKFTCDHCGNVGDVTGTIDTLEGDRKRSQ